MFTLISKLKLTKIWLLLPYNLRNLIKDFFGYSPYPDFKKLKISIKKTKTDQQKNFHFGTIIGSHRASNLLDSSLAKYLVDRGHSVSVLICDENLPACLNSSIWKSSKKDRLENTLSDSPKKQNLCKVCFKNSEKLWKLTNAKIYKISDLLTKADHKKIDDKIKKLKLLGDVFYKEINLREDIIAGCLRYLCLGDENKISKELYERYATSSLRICFCYEKILSIESIDTGVWVHGIYVPHGILNKIFKKKKINFYNYNTSYRENRFYFTKNDTYHKVFPRESSEQLSLDNFTESELQQAKEYLLSREKGSQDWQQFNNDPLKDSMQELKKIGFKEDEKDLAVLFTNVVWDARLHFQENLYDDMVEWIKDTVDFFKTSASKKLIIRVHPGELISHSVSREKVACLDFLQNLPENILLVPPESKISSYFLASISKLNLVYATKMSMELCLYDAPIVCCGDAWVKGKNATVDPSSKKEFLEILNLRDWEALNKKINKKKGLSYSHYLFEKKPIFFPYFKVSQDRKSFTVDLGNYEKAYLAKKSVLNFMEDKLIKKEEIIN